MARRYAEGTTVAVERSEAELRRLLRFTQPLGETDPSGPGYAGVRPEVVRSSHRFLASSGCIFSGLGRLWGRAPPGAGRPRLL